MKTQEFRDTTRKTPTPNHLTPRGRVVKNAAKVGAVGVLGVSVIVGAGNALQSSTTAHRVSANKAVLENGGEALQSTVYLGENVHARKSMSVNNGDSTSGTPDNIAFTVGKGDLKGKIVVVDDPLDLRDSAGNEWLAFEKPGTSPTTLEAKAKDLVYVAAGDLLINDPNSIVINPDKDGNPITDMPVELENGEFYQSDTGQPLPYALSSTTEADLGK